MKSDCLAFVMTASAAAAGRGDVVSRQAVLRAAPARPEDLAAMNPPDALLFELTRQAARCWARTHDPVAFERWGDAVRALCALCVEALSDADDPSRAAARERALKARARDAARGG